MSNVEKISVSVTKAQAELLKSAVESGDYGSSSEALREALRMWAAKRERDEAERQWLRAAIQEGIDSGPSPIQDFDEILRDAKRYHEDRMAARDEIGQTPDAA